MILGLNGRLRRCFRSWVSSRVLSFPLIPGNKKPHFGELFFQEHTYKLELRSKADEGETNEKEKTKKIIELNGN